MATPEHSVVKTLEKMVEYQDGSVVSKTVIGKKTGTVTLFAFDAGQSLSEHTAPFDALVYVMDGEAEISIAKNVHQLSKGQMIILPANIPHAVNAVSPFKMMLVMIKS
ncbi:MAG: cupin domain-containing protein [Calditrichia bacterium]|nr:cupin domain-containing protein [Calditrichota bacterium]MCB9067437.1 cupin domain-containing protein [Calditrichia bacterium]